MNQISQHNQSAVSRAPQRFSFDTVSIWVLSLSAALATLFLVPSATVSFLYTKILILALGALIAFAFFILARLTRGNIIVPPVPLLGALWLVPFAYVLSALFSGAGFGASFFGTQLEVDSLGFILLLALFATLAALIFRRTSQYRTAYIVFVGTLGLILLGQIGILLISHLSKSVSPAANLVGSFMDFGMIVGLGLTLALVARRFLTFTKRMRIAFWILVPVSLFMLALVNSPLVWVMVTLVAFGLFIEAILRRSVSVDESDLDDVETVAPAAETAPVMETNEMHSLAVPLITLVIALFFLIGGSKIGASLTTAFGTNVLDVRPSWQSTFAVGSHTYASSPVFGSGPNTFGQQWLKFRDRAINNTLFWNQNFDSGIGFVPTSFVTAGLLGALAWIAFLALFLTLGLRALLFRTPTDPFVRFVSVSSFIGSLYLFGMMIFSEPGPIVLVTGFLLIGIFISSLRYAGSRQEWGVVFARNPRIGFVIVFSLTLFLLASVAGAYVAIEHYLADYSYAKAATALGAGNLSEAQSAIAQSINFSPSARAYQLVAAISVAQMNKIATDTTLTPAQAQQQFQVALSSGVQAGTEAAKIAPNDYQNWLALGTVYQIVVPLGIAGAYDKSKAAYQHAISLDPTDPTLPYALAQLDIAHKDGVSAEADLTQAISLKPNYTQAIFLLSQLEAQQGKAKEALQAAEAAAYFAPNDPTVLFQVGILRSANGDTTGAVAALAQAVQLNPQYANARFYLAVMYASQNQFPLAVAQLQAVAALSTSNEQVVAADIATLQAGKNPFPPSQLGALGVPQPQVSDTTNGTHPLTQAASQAATTTVAK